jgi:hypothetical protein
LRSAGAQNLRGKILIQVGNPLDTSKGMPPTLTVCKTHALGEQTQKEFPDARVVKALNTVNFSRSRASSAIRISTFTSCAEVDEDRSILHGAVRYGGRRSRHNRSVHPGLDRSTFNLVRRVLCDCRDSYHLWSDSDFGGVGFTRA